jgi:hypothetical protein
VGLSFGFVKKGAVEQPIAAGRQNRQFSVLLLYRRKTTGGPCKLPAGQRGEASQQEFHLKACHVNRC